MLAPFIIVFLNAAHCVKQYDVLKKKKAKLDRVWL